MDESLGAGQSEVLVVKAFDQFLIEVLDKKRVFNRLDLIDPREMRLICFLLVLFEIMAE